MIVLDSDVLIGLLRRREPAVAWVESLAAEGEELATTSVNVAEVLRGSNRSHAELVTAARLLDALVEVPFGPRAARRYGRIMHDLDRAGAAIPEIDAMIAAATLEAPARLATGNRRHFGRIGDLELVAP